MHHPHLVLAPIVIGIINNQLLDTAHPLDGQVSIKSREGHITHERLLDWLFQGRNCR